MPNSNGAPWREDGRLFRRDEARRHFDDARFDFINGNWDSARAHYKAAVVAWHLEVKEANGKIWEAQYLQAKNDLLKFTKADPLFQTTWEILKVELERLPGIHLTQLYGKVPAVEKEQVSFFLSQAEELGLVRFEKTGPVSRVFLVRKP